MFPFQAELIATCQTNVKCLDVISETLDSGDSPANVTQDDVEQVHGERFTHTHIHTTQTDRHRQMHTDARRHTRTHIRVKNNLCPWKSLFWNSTPEVTTITAGVETDEETQVKNKSALVSMYILALGVV